MDKDEENKIMNFDNEVQNFVSYATSKGNLPKWHIDNYWYKTDALGYENLAECLISDLLKHSNIYKYTKYEILKGIYKGENRNFSKSKNFLDKKDNLITVYRLYFLETGKELSKDIYVYNSIRDRIKFVVEQIEQYSNIKNVGEIITSILEMDMFFLNEDRHFNNFALIRNMDTKIFIVAPIFDNGLCLLSDLNEYKMNVDVYKNIDKIKGKPFSTSLEEQCAEAEYLYGNRLKLGFTKRDVEEELEKYKNYYNDEVIERVRKIIFEQMRKYQYLF